MTTFQTPLKTQGLGGDTGNSQTETSGFVKTVKVFSMGGGTLAPRSIVSLPPQSTLVGFGAVATSAFASDVSAMTISFGNSAQASRYGTISVSALAAYRSFGTATVSGATDFDAGGTIVITGSAASTTTFTAGGARVFIEYVTVG